MSWNESLATPLYDIQEAAVKASSSTSRALLEDIRLTVVMPCRHIKAHNVTPNSSKNRVEQLKSEVEEVTQPSSLEGV